MNDKEYRWGRFYPADFWDAKGVKKVTWRKWYPWTASNDLAAKEFMEGTDYLVRCTICKEERLQGAGVYICRKQECREAVAVLIELGYDDSWGDIADQWYESWYGPDDYKSSDRAFADDIHDSATRTVRNTLAEPTTEGG